MNWILLILAISPFLINEAYAQEIIIVNQTTPCFLNATAGLHMWENCGADEDFINFALLPFEWITGGYFSMILVSILILGVYLKYHKVIYAFAVGAVFLPVSFEFFPDQFWGFVIIVIVVGFAAGLIYMIKRQTE